MSTPPEILETSPRDGLQNESTALSTEDKVELISRVIAAGAKRIEATSFVSHRRVPQLADAEAVMEAVPRPADVRYSALIANERGLTRAIAAGVDEVNVVVVATDTFCLKNQGMRSHDACALAIELVSGARAAGLTTTVTIAASFGCPFEGEVSERRLRDIVSAIAPANADEISLADTIGSAVPSEIFTRVAMTRAIVGPAMNRVHLHETRHTGLANAVAATLAGVTVLDSSIGGAGGCPFARGATGNVATEDLIYLFGRMGQPLGLRLSEVTKTTSWLEQRLGRTLPGAILRAGDFPRSVNNTDSRKVSL